MEITGAHFIGSTRSKKGQNAFGSISPHTQQVNGSTQFAEATEAEIGEATQMAHEAFSSYRKSSRDDRASFLEAIATHIEALGDQLIEECMTETGLPQARLVGERGRTANQLRLFAKVVRDGGWVDARIDTAQPDRQPIPKPDVRSMLRPLGPVAVFGASNFPLAFSVAGGDTASALAAGCPVVFKAHPAHPRTCELVAQAVVNAAEETNMPDGVFSMVHGRSHEVGGHLVKNPLIKAVAFTGSQGGGLALFQLANTRQEPIPVYAEMGSTNPVFLLPGAINAHQDAIAKGLVGSVNLGVGQFCTNPGLIFAPDQAETSTLVEKVADLFKEQAPGTMLSEGIANAYENGASALKSEGIVEKSAGKKEEQNGQAQSHFFQTTLEHFRESARAKEELFGPSTIFITAGNQTDLIQTVRDLEGQLTATIHGTDADLEEYRDLIGELEQKVGRLIINGYPTGVEVCHAMVHGGPFPSTTASGTTSVGTAAIRRFVRPVCYQDFPQSLLPTALQDANPWGIHRLVDGKLTKNEV